MVTQPPRRTLHIIDTTGPGGAETLFIQIAKNFNTTNDTSLALIRGPGWVETSLKKNDVPYLVEDNKGSMNFAYLYYLVKLIRSHKIDLIHCHLLGSSVYGSLAGLLTSTPVISTFHGLVDIKPEERMAKLKMLLVRRGSTIVAVSDAIESFLCSEFGFSEKDVSIIPNGIDSNHFRPKSNNDLREHYSIDPGTVIIGALGNVRPAKDYTTAIKALADIVKSGYDAKLFIGGDPKPALVRPLIDEASRLGIENRIHFLGFVDDVDTFLSGIDLFVSSSLTEGQPLSVFQAMSKALPIIATRSGVESFLTDGENAWLAPASAPEMLAIRLQDAIRNKEERKRRGHNARITVEEKFSQATMLDRYAQLYDRLCR